MNFEKYARTLAVSRGLSAADDRQIMTLNYVGAIKNGEPVIIGKVK